MKKFIFLFLFFGSLSVSAQIDRVEPPYWWSDMNYSEVQVMFYGKNIAEYEVSAPKEMIISNVRKTENPNYVFVTVQTEGLPAGSYDLRFSKKGKKSFSHSFELKQREAGSALREGFNSSDVIYLIMPDRFANGDPSNDSHPELQEKANRNEPGGRHGGDLEGIIQNLDYLEDLGVTAIWTTPLLEDDDPTYSYHTYAQSDVYRICLLYTSPSPRDS